MSWLLPLLLIASTGWGPPLSSDCESGDDQEAVYVQRGNPPLLWVCAGGATGWVQTPATGPQGPTGPLAAFVVPIHADAGANWTLTNSPNAERFQGNVPGRAIRWLPLTGYTQVRLRGVVVTSSASVNTPKIRILHRNGAYSTTLGDYSAIGSSEVSISLTGTGEKDSGWINLVAGAQAEVFVAVTELGGDGAADPALGYVQLYFK